MKKMILFLIVSSTCKHTHAMFGRALQIATRRTLSTTTEISKQSPHAAKDAMTLLTKKIRSVPQAYDGSNPRFRNFFKDLQLEDDFFQEKTPEEINKHVQTIVAEILTGKLDPCGDKVIQAAIDPSTLIEEVRARINYVNLRNACPILESRYKGFDESDIKKILTEVSSELLINELIQKINLSYGLGASMRPIDAHAIKALRKALFKYRLDRLDDGGTFFWIAVIAIFLYEFSVLDAVWTTEKESRLIE